MTSPLLAGIPISSRFAERLGIVSNETVTQKPVVQEEDKFQVVGNQIQDLEMKVNQQLEELKQGWNRLPGAAGKRDSDVQNLRDQFKKKYPKLYEPDPSIMEQYEMSLRDKGIPEETIEEVMMPIWSTYGKKIKEKVKKTTEVDPLLSAVEKLAGMIEGMNKPKTEGIFL